MKKMTFFKAFALLILSALSMQAFSQASSGLKPEVILYRHNSASGIGSTAVVEGDTLGNILFKGLTAKQNIPTGATIRSFITGPVAPGYLPANLVFRTGAPANQDRMVITEDGLVGIGTMLPQYNLHVVGNTHTTGNFFGRIHFDNNFNTDDAPNTYFDEAYFERKLRNTIGVPADPMGSTAGGTLTLAPGTDSHDHQLFFGNDGIFHRRQNGNAASWAGAAWYKLLTSEDIHGTTNFVSKFTAPNSLGDSQIFDDGASVGINTAAPIAKLDVNGTFHVTNDATLSAGLGVAGNAVVSGNTTVGNILMVNGTTQLNGTAQVSGAFTANGGATLNNGTTVGTSLDVSGVSRMNGQVAISTNPGVPSFASGYALSVEGRTITDELRVALTGSWPDYVFDQPSPNPLEWEKYIAENQHLPGMPSAAEVACEGNVNVGETQRLLLEKVEQLTLMIIAQQKEIDLLKQQ